ncbi:uncharacterized protein J3R85_016554 [Psidium guajava]|nr:uncharacterized protein J3R85_016554 [Psidium guajava]
MRKGGGNHQVSPGKIYPSGICHFCNLHGCPEEKIMSSSSSSSYGGRVCQLNTFWLKLT